MLAKIYLILRREGVTGLLKKIKNRLYLKTNIYRIELSCADFNQILESQSFKLSNMSQRDLSILINLYPEEISTVKAEQLKQLLRDSNSFNVFILKDENDNILTYGCVSLISYLDSTMNYRFRINNDEFFYFDAYTFSRHRNKGAQKISAMKYLNILQQKGKSVGYCMIDEGNIYSERAMLHLGFQPIGHIHLIKFFGFKFNKTCWYDSLYRLSH